jgi:hypothetical protein
MAIKEFVFICTLFIVTVQISAMEFFEDVDVLLSPKKRADSESRVMGQSKFVERVASEPSMCMVQSRAALEPSACAEQSQPAEWVALVPSGCVVQPESADKRVICFENIDERPLQICVEGPSGTNVIFNAALGVSTTGDSKLPYRKGADLPVGDWKICVACMLHDAQLFLGSANIPANVVKGAIDFYIHSKCISFRMANDPAMLRSFALLK